MQLHSMMYNSVNLAADPSTELCGALVAAWLAGRSLFACAECRFADLFRRPSY